MGHRHFTMKTVKGFFNGTAQFAFPLRNHVDFRLHTFASPFPDKDSNLRVKEAFSKRMSNLLNPQKKAGSLSFFTGKTEFLGLDLVDMDSKYISEMIRILDGLTESGKLKDSTW